CTTTDQCAPRRWIDTHASHQGQIDQHSAVAGTAARAVMTAAPDRQHHAPVARKADCHAHILGRGTTGGHARLLEEHAVPDLPDLVIGLILRLNALAPETAP